MRIGLLQDMDLCQCHKMTICSMSDANKLKRDLSNEYWQVLWLLLIGLEIAV